VPADPFLLLLVLAVAINVILLLAVGLTAIRARGGGLDRPPSAARWSVADRAGRLLLGPDGVGSATYDRVVRVVAWTFIVAVTAIVAASGLWQQTQASIFVLMAVAAVFMLVVHDIVPDEILGSARPVVEGSVGITFATLLVVLTGGPSSPFFLAYALIVAGAALVLSPPMTLVVTAIAVGGYLVGVLAGVLTDPTLPRLAVPQLVAVAVNIAALVLLAYMAMVVAREQRRSRDMAIRLGTVDSLTGLYNRAYFFAALDREIQRSARSRRGFCLLMLDLDGLKPINDRFGHFHGDRVLRAVGEVIRRRVRRIDTAARYGGDEFVVLLPETAPSGAYVLAEKIRVGAADLGMEAEGVRIAVSLSIGVVAYPADGRVADELMIAADQAMYTSKRRGKNRIVAYGGRGAASRRIAPGRGKPGGPTRRGPRNTPARTAR
jgi:diguanylate cyclase (GGDEF)-like protein